MEEFMNRIRKNLDMAMSCASSGITDSASMLVSGRIDDARITVIIMATISSKQDMDITVKVKASDPISINHELYTTRISFLEKEGYTKESIMERIEEELI